MPGPRAAEQAVRPRSHHCVGAGFRIEGLPPNPLCLCYEQGHREGEATGVLPLGQT